MLTLYIIALILCILYSVYFSATKEIKDKILLRSLILAIIPVVNFIMVIIYSIAIIVILSIKP